MTDTYPALAAQLPQSERDANLERLRARMVAFGASRWGRPTAEDLAQEVMLVLLEKYPDVHTVEDLLPLGFKILRFKAATTLRKRSRRGEDRTVDATEMPDLRALGASPLEDAERRQLEQRLRSAVGRLEGRCREVIRLRLAGLAFPAIQDRMGAASINTVYTWDLRCRKRLLELLARPA